MAHGTFAWTARRGDSRGGRRIHYRYHIDPDRRLVIAVFFGDATLTDAKAMVAELYADARHSPELRRVYDCREVTRLPAVAELRGVAELLRQNVDPAVKARRAIVVRPGTAYGLGRMLQALVDLVGVELNLFTDVDEAIEWAAANPEQPDPR